MDPSFLPDALFPFAAEIWDSFPPSQFQRPRNLNPKEYVAAYLAAMEFYSANPTRLPSTITPPARAWFTEDPPESTEAWDVMAAAYTGAFRQMVTQPLPQPQTRGDARCTSESMNRHSEGGQETESYDPSDPALPFANEVREAVMPTHFQQLPGDSSRMKAVMRSAESSSAAAAAYTGAWRHMIAKPLPEHRPMDRSAQDSQPGDSRNKPSMLNIRPSHPRLPNKSPSLSSPDQQPQHQPSMGAPRRLSDSHDVGGSHTIAKEVHRPARSQVSRQDARAEQRHVLPDVLGSGRVNDYNRPGDYKFTRRAPQARGYKCNNHRFRSPPRHPGYIRSVQKMAISEYTPLTASAGEIYARLPDKNMLPTPPRIRKPRQREAEDWCQYHRSPGHATDDCRHLKKAIERLVQKGYLSEYVDHDKNEPAMPERGSPPNNQSEYDQYERPIPHSLPQPARTGDWEMTRPGCLHQHQIEEKDPTKPSP